MSWHILKVTLAHVRPAIWRRLCVPSDTPLDVLHLALQAAFGWQDSHLHEFRTADARYGAPDVDEDAPEDLLDESEFTLADVLPRKSSRMEYLYDFGDDWFHTVSVEDIEKPAPRGSGRSLRPHRSATATRCLDGARAAPPEDCGGPAGYAEFLEAIADPQHERHAELLEWVGGEFDPERFVIADINRELSALA